RLTEAAVTRGLDPRVSSKRRIDLAVGRRWSGQARPRGNGNLERRDDQQDDSHRADEPHQRAHILHAEGIERNIDYARHDIEQRAQWESPPDLFWSTTAISAAAKSG